MVALMVIADALKQPLLFPTLLSARHIDLPSILQTMFRPQIIQLR
jgi:hypothetical protein